MIFCVGSNSDMRRCSGEMGVVEQCLVGELISRICARPIWPAILFDAEPKKIRRKCLRIAGGDNWDSSVLREGRRRKQESQCAQEMYDVQHAPKDWRGWIRVVGES